MMDCCKGVTFFIFPRNLCCNICINFHTTVKDNMDSYCVSFPLLVFPLCRPFGYTSFMDLLKHTPVFWMLSLLCLCCESSPQVLVIAISSFNCVPSEMPLCHEIVSTPSQTAAPLLSVPRLCVACHMLCQHCAHACHPQRYSECEFQKSLSLSFVHLGKEF